MKPDDSKVYEARHHGIRGVECAGYAFGKRLPRNHLPFPGLIAFIPVFNVKQVQPLFIGKLLEAGNLHDPSPIGPISAIFYVITNYYIYFARLLMQPLDKKMWLMC